MSLFRGAQKTQVGQLTTFSVEGNFNQQIIYRGEERGAQFLSIQYSLPRPDL
jgi:hypothetical protein